MERHTLIKNPRLRHGVNRYVRYIGICSRHVKDNEGRSQLCVLLSVANRIRENVIKLSLIHNRNRMRSIERDILVHIECSYEMWTDLYYTRAFEHTKDGERHTQRAQRVLRTAHNLLDLISAESLPKDVNDYHNRSGNNSVDVGSNYNNDANAEVFNRNNLS